MKCAIALVVCGLLAVSNAAPGKVQRKVFPDRIAGGEDAKQGEIPFQIQLQLFGSHYCGGSLVEVGGQQIIVSAAHCVEYNANSYTLVAGELNLRQNSGLEQTRRVKQIIAHREYDDWTYENDIAFLIPETPFQINENVKTIALPESRQQTTGEIVVSGWGNTQGGNDANILQKVQIPVVSDADCQSAYDAEGETIAESMLCAGLLGVGGKDSCQGDSGGPLRAVDGGYLAGVVSWGYGCADARYPGVNSEVSYFVDWISANLP